MTAARAWTNLTDMFNQDDIVAEMTKKYRDTWLKLTVNNKSFLAYYKYYEAGYHYFKDEQGGDIRLTMDTDIDINIFMPRRGLYNTKHGVVFFVRNPFRQYRRGISKDSASATRLYYILNGHEVYNEMPQHIWDIAKKELQEPMSLDEGLQILKEKGDVALSREFAISLNHLNDDPTTTSLFYEDVYIGSIKDNKIKVITPILYQEVIDNSHIWGKHYTVELVNG
jgi:hypothetical protein